MSNPGVGTVPQSGNCTEEIERLSTMKRIEMEKCFDIVGWMLAGGNSGGGRDRKTESVSSLLVM